MRRTGYRRHWVRGCAQVARAQARTYTTLRNYTALFSWLLLAVSVIILWTCGQHLVSVVLAMVPAGTGFLLAAVSVSSARCVIRLKSAASFFEVTYVSSDRGTLAPLAMMDSCPNSCLQDAFSIMNILDVRPVLRGRMRGRTHCR